MIYFVNNVVIMAYLGIEIFVVFVFFKGDGGEKGDRGVDGFKVIF